MDWDASRPWYHGSPFQLFSVRKGSTITQDRDLARVFSHKPSFVSQDIGDEGERAIKHTGRRAGYLYRIAEEVGPEDICPHPQMTMLPGQEWLTKRDLRVEHLCLTQVRVEELLTEEKVSELQQKHNAPNRRTL